MKNPLGYLFLVFALLVQIAAAPLQTAAVEPDKAPTWAAPVNYLAIGDSLAAGINPAGELGKSYADFLAVQLAGEEVLSAYNKGFAYPGYTTANVLNDLLNDAVKPVAGIGYQSETAAFQQSVKEATLITLTAGANDVLSKVKFDEQGAPQFSLADVQASLADVAVNTKKIVAKIYELNPKADVYVMGYYNSFPYADQAHQPQIGQLVKGLNTAIIGGITGTPAHFVETEAAIAKDFKTYLPNPQNIHLSEAGYQVVKDVFYDAVSANYPWFAKDVLTVETADASAAVLNWQPVIDTAMIETYRIFNGSEQIGEVMSPVTTYEAEGLEAGEDYLFTVQAVDKNGRQSFRDLTVMYKHHEQPEALRFTDIADHWAKDVIETAAAKGILGGYQDHTFRPDQSLTRAQAASILVRALQLQPTSEKSAFIDLADYADATKRDIQAAYDSGLVKGIDGRFMPNQSVTRAQLALMVSRAYEHAAGSGLKPSAPAPFSDITRFSKETQAAIAGLYEFNIISGDQGKFNPNAHTTRAHAAKMIVHSLEAIGR